MAQSRIFIDMDGVLADYNRGAEQSGMHLDEFHRTPGAFRHLDLMPGAIEAVDFLRGLGYDLFLASKPSLHSPSSAMEKVLWVQDHFPFLSEKLILTHDKGLLGHKWDFLIDDRPHVANCFLFPGIVLEFKEGLQWPEIMEFFRSFEITGGDY